MYHYTRSTMFHSTSLPRAVHSFRFTHDDRLLHVLCVYYSLIGQWHSRVYRLVFFFHNKHSTPHVLNRYKENWSLGWHCLQGYNQPFKRINCMLCDDPFERISGAWPAILKYKWSLLIVVFIAMFDMRILHWLDVNDALNMKRSQARCF